MNFKEFIKRDQKVIIPETADLVNMPVYGEPTSQQKKRLEQPLRYFPHQLPEKFKQQPFPSEEETLEELDYLISLQPRDEDFFNKFDDSFSHHFYDYVKDNKLPFTEQDEKKMKEIVSEAANMVLDLKFHYNRERPYQVAERTGNEDFVALGSETAKTPAYPSGHTSQSRLLARIFGDLFPEHRTAFLNISIDCMLSREEGGVHFPSDNTFGIQVGEAMYEMIKPDLSSLFSLSEVFRNTSFGEVYKKSGLGKWFHSQSAGGDPGWDRYGLDGQKLGKCGDSKEGDAYAACLSKQKADKLGKEGIASFVRRKRAAQKKAGDTAKGGEKTKGQAPVNVRTENRTEGVVQEGNLAESRPKDMKQFIKNMKDKLEKKGINLSKPHPRAVFEPIIGSTATSRLAHRGVIDIESKEDRQTNEENVPVNKALWDRVLDQARSKFDVFPSAYASAWASREYKKRGGKWVTKS